MAAAGGSAHFSLGNAFGHVQNKNFNRKFAILKLSQLTQRKHVNFQNVQKGGEKSCNGTPTWKIYIYIFARNIANYRNYCAKISRFTSSEYNYCRERQKKERFKEKKDNGVILLIQDSNADVSETEVMAGKAEILAGK